MFYHEYPTEDISDYFKTSLPVAAIHSRMLNLNQMINLKQLISHFNIELIKYSLLKKNCGLKGHFMRKWILSCRDFCQDDHFKYRVHKGVTCSYLKCSLGNLNLYIGGKVVA